MDKNLGTFVLGIIATVAILFFTGFDLSKLPKVGGGGPAGTTAHGPAAPVDFAQRHGLRIGTYNIQVFGQKKLDNKQVVDVLVAVARQFDVLAIQEVRSSEQDVLPRFVELINATGAHYDYAISPRLGRTNSKEQYAFIFDTATIDMDRTMSYVVGDPDDLLHREPFVGAFRVKGVPAEQAFTFSLVNIHTDPDEVPQEMNALADVLRAVRQDSRHEDDVIVLGDLNADDRHFGDLGRIPDIDCVIRNTPTNTRGTAQYDNLVFDRLATVEYLGKGGVMDLMGEFKITLDQALDVSDHLPVWAEFSPYEGGGRQSPALARLPRRGDR